MTLQQRIAQFEAATETTTNYIAEFTLPDGDTHRYVTDNLEGAQDFIQEMAAEYGRECATRIWESE